MHLLLLCSPGGRSVADCRCVRGSRLCCGPAPGSTATVADRPFCGPPPPPSHDVLFRALRPSAEARLGREARTTHGCVAPWVVPGHGWAGTCSHSHAGYAAVVRLVVVVDRTSAFAVPRPRGRPHTRGVRPALSMHAWSCRRAVQNYCVPSRDDDVG